MAAFGLQMVGGGEPEPEAFAVHAANWPALRLWAELWPRWRMIVGMGGAVRQGLDLAQLESALAVKGVPRGEWPGLYRDLLEMEGAALEALAER